MKPWVAYESACEVVTYCVEKFCRLYQAVVNVTCSWQVFRKPLQVTIWMQIKNAGRWVVYKSLSNISPTLFGIFVGWSLCHKICTWQWSFPCWKDVFIQGTRNFRLNESKYVGWLKSEQRFFIADRDRSLKDTQVTFIYCAN